MAGNNAEREMLAKEVLGEKQVKDYGIRPVQWIRAKAGVLNCLVQWGDHPENKKIFVEGNGGWKFAGYKLTRQRLEKNRWSEKGVIELGPDKNEHLVEPLTPEKHFRFLVTPFVRTFVRREVLGDSIQSKSIIVNKKLPEGWVTVRSGNGSRHFLNTVTKEQQIEEPDPSDHYFLPTEIRKNFTIDQRAEMLEYFLEYDTDRSGSLSSDELWEVLDDMDIKIPEKKFEKLFSTLDTDKSGELEYIKFVQLYTMCSKGAESMLGPQLRKFGKLAKKGASNAVSKAATRVQERLSDAINNVAEEVASIIKKVSIEEKMMGWASTITDEGIMYYYNAETRETSWELPDQVRFYCSPELKLRFKENEFQDIIEAFKKADTDGSGALDESEVLGVMKGFGANMSRKRLKELICVLDVDGSGEIEFEEFVGLVYGARKGKVGVGKFLFGMAKNIVKKKKKVKVEPEELLNENATSTTNQDNK